MKNKPKDLDSYLRGLEPADRAALQKLRRTIRSIVPAAEECISYNMPAFRIDGKVVAGFSAFSRHLSYFPFSGSVLSKLQKELAGYVTTNGSLHFDADAGLPASLVRKLIRVRRDEIARKAKQARSQSP